MKECTKLFYGPVLLLIVLFCAAHPGTAANGFPIRLTDDAGRPVSISRPPQRIVSLAPSNTELLFAIGAGPRVVGVTNYCNYPKAVSGIQKVGDMNLNYEAILSLRPDLVVTVGSMQGEAVQRLAQLGLTVIVLEAKRTADIPRHVRLLGKATGLPSENLAASFEQRVSLVQKKAVLASHKPRIFVEIWNEPLMTAGPGTYIDELITMAGGRNIASDAGTPWPQFSSELVIQRDPGVIVLTCYNKAEVLQRKSWQAITALQKGKVFEVDPDMYVRPGPRLVDALEELARLLHPDIFK